MHPGPSAYACTTPLTFVPAKPSSYAGVYSCTAPVIRRRSQALRQTLCNNSLTSDFWSLHSATDASIFVLDRSTNSITADEDTCFSLSS